MGNYTKIRVRGSDLIADYLRKKLGSANDNSVSEEEFIKFLNDMIESINDHKYSSWKYVLDDQSFEEMCHQAIVIESKPWGQALKFENNILSATYVLKAGKLWNRPDDYNIRNFMCNHNTKLIEEKKQEVNNFDLSTLSGNELQLSKKIAAYIVFDLIQRYVKEMTERGSWPKQCKDINEFIFEKDLATVIALDGTRETFINLYKHAVGCIAEKIVVEKDFQLSNNRQLCLAHANFARITDPFPSFARYVYNESELHNNSILIKVKDGKAISSEEKCTYSDPYGEWSDDMVRGEKNLTAYDCPMLEEKVKNLKR